MSPDRRERGDPLRLWIGDIHNFNKQIKTFYTFILDSTYSFQKFYTSRHNRQGLDVNQVNKKILQGIWYITDPWDHPLDSKILTNGREQLI